jgi:peptidoglycan-associated lipoprotein
MATQAYRLVVISLLVLGLGVAGCARRPGMSGTSAPAPSGAAGGMRQASEEGRQRPELREFVVEPDLKDIQFDFDRADIRPEAAEILDVNAAWLKANPGHQVLVEGHTDDRGTNEYNLALGDRRARAARNYLVSHGVAAVRITMVSYGEERPMCTERSEDCWTQNRRAHFSVRSH